MPTSWETLVANALIGTDRQAPQLPTGKGKLAGLLSQVPTEPEPMLLQSAGILASYQQAGQCTYSQVEQLPKPCPAEPLSRCSDRTHQHLQIILNGEYKDVLFELLDLIAQTHQYVPAETLPALLDQGRGHPPLRSSIQTVIGERGRWLAQYNSAWAYAAGQPLPYTQAGEIAQEAVENLWKTSDYALRVDLLKTFRSLKPQAAREMLSTTWKQEKAKDRATFLAILTTHLSVEDEPFLEIALHDRAQEVRTCAGGLLAHLPDSQYCQRMTAQVQTYVQFEDNTLSITLPKDDGSWKTERSYSQSSQLGRRGSLLMRIVAGVPLNFWSGDVDALIQTAQTHQQGAALLQGWTIAAQRQANPSWIQRMMGYWLSNPTEKQTYDPIDFLIKRLPAEQVEPLFLKYLAESSSPAEKATKYIRLAKWGPLFSPNFSQVWWETLEPDLNLLLANTSNSSQARSPFATLLSLFETVSFNLHPIIADDVIAYLNHLNSDSFSTYQQNSLMLWQNTLEFRKSIWAEF